MGLVQNDGSLELYDGKLRIVDNTGKTLEEFEPENYLNYIGEHVEDWSYMKFPFYKKQGFPDGISRVGPLGRLNAADSISTPLANKELKWEPKVNFEDGLKKTIQYFESHLKGK